MERIIPMISEVNNNANMKFVKFCAVYVIFSAN